MEFEECEEPGEGKLTLANGKRTKEECPVAEDAGRVNHGPEARHETR
jgi:hypothetical protein